MFIVFDRGSNKISQEKNIYLIVLKNNFEKNINDLNVSYF